MRRTWSVWLGYSLACAVLAGVMAWITLTALRLDSERADALRRAALEENVRLALWRMDSWLSALLAREAARPHASYAHTPGRNGNSASEYVILRFEFGPDGRLTSPQVPNGGPVRRSQAAQAAAQSEGGGQHLATLRAATSRESLLALLPDQEPSPEPMPRGKTASVDPGVLSAKRQQAFASNEYQMRTENFIQMQASQSAVLFGDSAGPMAPVWVGDELLLARKVGAGSRAYVQGCLLDWPALRGSLVESVGDLLPDAGLRPLDATGEEETSRRLAALPAVLVPGELPSQEEAGPWSPIRASLVSAWAGAVLAVIAVAVLLRGTVALSERRADFVSAVTHELRTPLTTFRIYTEMLADGIVKDDEARSSYLKTLRSEAERLSHLVENVLSYARLERGRGGASREAVELGFLLDRVSERLAGRAAQVGMRLEVSVGSEAAGAVVRVSPTAVEQVLFNLVDNACKYAADAEDRRVLIEAALGADLAAIRVCDHGPGIPPRDARRIFRPFRKSAQAAAESAPGVGLGLALSRRLARDMGGRLTLERTAGGGACFVLELPLAT